jgi:stage II sporulation protein GA (sporulation sigma-E factor processing peptidase)
MLYISFTPKDLKEMIKMLIYFYLTSFVFGGAALGVIYMVNSGKISIQNGMIIGKYTLKTIIVGAMVAFIIVILAFKMVKSKFSKNDLFCNIAIKINEKEIKTKAMVDTGNLLKEPITNVPVVVVEHTLLYDLVPKEILDNIENILGGDLEKIPENIKNEYMSKLKVIPFTSLGKQNGMLLGLKADGLEVETANDVKNVDKVIIGMYNKKLSKKEEYSALLGIDVI